MEEILKERKAEEKRRNDKKRKGRKKGGEERDKEKKWNEGIEDKVEEIDGGRRRIGVEKEKVKGKGRKEGEGTEKNRNKNKRKIEGEKLRKKCEGNCEQRKGGRVEEGEKMA